MSIIILSRNERDLIHNSVRYNVGEVGGFGRVIPDSRAEALEGIEVLGRVADSLRGVIALYDELGWEQDDPRQTFEVTMGDTLIATVRDVAVCARDEIHCAHRSRDEINKGMLPEHASGYTTVDEAFAGLAKQIEEHEREIARAEALLARIEQQAGVTA